MHLVATLVALSVMSAVPFGPPGTTRHPMVGPRAAIPGGGPEPVLTQAPEEVNLHNVKAAGQLRSRGGSNPLFLSFLVYKNFLTQVDGSRCQHYPTCSAYGAQAVGRYNVLGVLMTMDRLWAGANSSSVRTYRLVHGVGPTPRHYDPIEDSAFWFGFPMAAWLGMPVLAVDAARGRDKDPDDDEKPASPPASR